VNRKSTSLIDAAAEIAEVVLPQVESVLGAAFAADRTDQQPTVGQTTPVKPRRKRARSRWGLLLLGGAAAGGAVLWRRLRDESASDNWESSYTPTPRAEPSPPAASEDDPNSDA
jgi:hypothetical protein